MVRSIACSAALALALGSGLVLAQQPDNSVADTIAARRGLMNQLTTLQALIETRLASSGDAGELPELGNAVAATLEASAVLFPPQTNLLGGAPAPDDAQTTAAAAIWDDLPAFENLLRSAARQSRLASAAPDPAGFKAAWSDVAAACTSCHASFVVYDPFAALN